ncbi:hypothetical protein FSST1_001404 [Fusarium sambucinum]
MSDKANQNDVPMQGQGAYSSHAALQHQAMLKALPLFQKAAKAVADHGGPHTVVIEYGSAHGNNSLEPMQAILEATPPRQVELLFSDRPENDFSTLSTTITSWADALDKNEFPHPLFLSMIPRNFYQKVVPPQSAHLGFSLAALHHLDHVPSPTGVQSEDDQLLQKQAHLDLSAFLELRAQEIISRGSLVLSFVGQASAGYENYSGPVDACRNAMIEMVQQGIIPVPVAGSFRVPTYNRTLEDVRKVLDEMSNVWDVHDLFEADITHPAIHDLNEKQVKDEDASREYASIVIDWMMAVCSGYFLKALKVGNEGRYSEEEEKKLLNDWVARTKELFIRDHKDEEVVCSFVYVHLSKF